MLICCVCLRTKSSSTNEKDSESLDIFDEIGESLKISQIIGKYLWFQPIPEEKERNQICCKCWKNLCDFHEFYESVEQIHQNWKKLNELDNKSMVDKINFIRDEIEEFSMEEKIHPIEDVGDDEIETGLIDILDDDEDAENSIQKENPLQETEIESKGNVKRFCIITKPTERKNSRKGIKRKNNNTTILKDKDEVKLKDKDETKLKDKDEENQEDTDLLLKSKISRIDYSSTIEKFPLNKEISLNDKNSSTIEKFPLNEGISLYKEISLNEENSLNENYKIEEETEIEIKSIEKESENEIESIENITVNEEERSFPQEEEEEEERNMENIKKSIENQQNQEINSIQSENSEIKLEKISIESDGEEMMDHLNEESTENLENRNLKMENRNLTMENKCPLEIKKIKRSRRMKSIDKQNINENTPKLRGKTAKGNKLLLENESLIKKHLLMLCDLCPYTASDFIELTQHFKEQHVGQKSYIKCCTRKLNCASDIIQHAHLHEDPNYFRCQQCQRTFSNRSALKDHFLQYHAPEENLSFACDICPRKFARYNLLQHHKSKHIPKEKRSFFCTKCEPPRAFANEYILRVHINSRHLKATNICHVCAKEIRSKQSFEKHVRSHFGDSGPRVKCPREDCNSWLKDDENLKQHLRRFHTMTQEELKCPQCGRLCRSKHSLANHQRETHSPRIFTCEECKKSFKSAKSLKEHMAGHSGEPLYSCQFCSRAFNSSANMYSHKKKKHPEQWRLVCQRNKMAPIS